MKNEVTVNGKTFKVGDVIRHKHFPDREILFFGTSKYLFKNVTEEGSAYMTDLVIWNVKPKTRIIKYEFEVDFYSNGFVFLKHDRNNLSECYKIIKTETFTKEIEVEMEGE